MQPQQSRACMIEYFRSKSTKAYKRKSTQNSDVTVLEPADMDIDDGSDDDNGSNNDHQFSSKKLVLSFSFSRSNQYATG